MRDTFFYFLGLLLIDFVFVKLILIKTAIECIKLYKFKCKSLFTHGLIVGYHSKLDVDQYTQYAPIVEYKANDEIVYELKSEDFAMVKPIVGKKVTVNYNPDNYNDGIVSLSSFLRFKIFLFSFMFILLIAINYVTIISLL